MWKEILFVSNFASDGQMCLGWGWYLQVDFQLFIAGVVLLSIYNRYPRVMLGLCGVLGVGGMTYMAYWTYRDEIHLFIDLNHPSKNQSKFLESTYTNPLARCPPYLMGLVFGIFYMQFRSNQTFI